MEKEKRAKEREARRLAKQNHFDRKKRKAERQRRKEEQEQQEQGENEQESKQLLEVGDWTSSSHFVRNLRPKTSPLSGAKRILFTK